ncbi:MAG TPA: MFS transporter [Sphingomicrobium sp.]|nr:MFS transporter [Sphingomicrobium sp.]
MRPQAKRRLSVWHIASLCCGLFGVQIVWGLQNVNTSRIFQTLGADVSDLPMLWIAGPIAGLIVQPIIGHWSDRTWTRLGRRRPFLLVGTFLTALSLLMMPNVTTVWSASLMLWLLTISINIVMEPFRALLADLLPEDQRDTGFALQVLFIGSGAVFASVLPWLSTHMFGWSAQAPGNELPPSIHAAYYAGAAGLTLTVLWSVFAARERPPAKRAATENPASDDSRERKIRLSRHGLAWLAAAAIGVGFVFTLDLQREGYVLCAAAAGLGFVQLLAANSTRRWRSGPGAVASAIIGMPPVLRRLALTQFATWFGLFAMWVYLVPAVAGSHYGGPAPGSEAYHRAADQVGILFAAYNGIAALFALLLPALVAAIGRRRCHALCLGLGAIGFAAIGSVDDANWLWLPTAAIGCAWASIMSIPYAMVASAVPPDRVGLFMGIHNIFLVLPQLAAAALLGPLIGELFSGNAMRALDVAAVAFLFAALSTFLIPSEAEPIKP